MLLQLIMDYEWDENKNQLNIKKHTLNFEDSKEVLQNAHLLIEDIRYNYGESRYIAVGYLRKRLVIIVYTKRKDVYRIISMRKANEREQANYKKQLESIRHTK